MVHSIKSYWFKQRRDARLIILINILILLFTAPANPSAQAESDYSFLKFGTYLGGSGYDLGQEIAVDSNKNV